MFGSLVIIAAFAAQLAESRIVNGRVVTIREVPHQVALLNATDTVEGQFCGGSIISDRWILTAAHCVRTLLPVQIAVRAGSSFKASGGQLHPVAWKEVHPNYNNVTFDSDYALLKLMFPLTLNEDAAIAVLPDSGETVQPGKVCTVSGWGMTMTNGPSDQLRAVDVPIANHDRCRKNYGKKITITSNMLCAGYDAGGKDACLGDSGGPLTCAGKVVGSVSVGWGCAMRNLYGIYADVAPAREWIRSITNVWE